MGLFGVFCCSTAMFFDFREAKAHHGIIHQLQNPDDTDDSRIMGHDDSYLEEDLDDEASE